MARQKSMITFVGTLDGINFYLRNGKYLARKAGGGFSTESFKNNPKMEGVRRRSTDFGHCSRVNKHFKEALRPFMEHVNDGTLHSRMMRLFLTLLNYDTVHEKGAKQLHTAMGDPKAVTQMRKFRFTPSGDPLTHFGSNTITVAKENNKVVIGDWYLSPKDFPKGAKMMGFQLGRLHFDFKTLDYELAVGDHQMFSIEDEARPFELTVEKPTTKGVAFMVLGLQYFVNDGEEDLRESSGIRGAGFCLL